MSSRMYIVARRDLEMPPGKLAAQVGHAAVRMILKAEHSKSFPAELLQNYLSGDGNEAKIVLGVDSEDALNEVFDACVQMKIPCGKVVDSGRTVFKEPTLTCIGIGPIWDTEIGTFKHLKLY